MHKILIPELLLLGVVYIVALCIEMAGARVVFQNWQYITVIALIFCLKPFFLYYRLKYLLVGLSIFTLFFSLQKPLEPLLHRSEFIREASRINTLEEQLKKEDKQISIYTQKGYWSGLKVLQEDRIKLRKELQELQKNKQAKVDTYSNAVEMLVIFAVEAIELSLCFYIIRKAEKLKAKTAPKYLLPPKAQTAKSVWGLYQHESVIKLHQKFYTNDKKIYDIIKVKQI